MLNKAWPGNFRRTITTGKKGKEVKQTLEFIPGVPVDLTGPQAEALMPDIGVALDAIEFDDKHRPRVITDDVLIEAAAAKENESSEPVSTN